MAHRQGQGRDPLSVTGQRYMGRRMLAAALEGISKEKIGRLETKPVSGVWETVDAESADEPLGGARDVNFRRAWIKGFEIRLKGAIVGGAFLIFPMWLMILHQTLYTGLITATVLVAFFGLIMAVSLTKLMDVVSVTAAYAAVLVVLVSLTTAA